MRAASLSLNSEAIYRLNETPGGGNTRFCRHPSLFQTVISNQRNNIALYTTMMQDTARSRAQAAQINPQHAAAEIES